MISHNEQAQVSADEASRLLELIESALTAQRLEELADRLLPAVSALMQSPAALLYCADARLPEPLLLQHGFDDNLSSRLEDLCAEHLQHMSGAPGLRASPQPGGGPKALPSLQLYPLRATEGCIGLLGWTSLESASPSSEGLVTKLQSVTGGVVGHLTERAACQRQLSHLNTYLTVSSLLSQPLDLHDLLEVALYSCMEVVAAEAASVLLLEDEKESFLFYQVEGPAKPVLMTATFPADKGLAGAVLQAQQSEVINDVQRDPRFYELIDSQSGFQTQNMIAVPLVAGEEKVGVLEVLNKAGGASFIDEERLLLVSLAEEIAFAIRNAKVFEYVANTYCRQRQGQMSCRGCERPLGSWTPCVKYREVSV